jgi:bifunctional non-homologous end joining protein LigD
MTKLPKISPITLKRLREPFDHPDWLFELKHDGFRAVAYISDAKCQLVSRQDNVFRSFEPLCDALSKLRVKDAILDGEIICLDGEGVSVFNQLMFRRGVQYFYAFDLLWLNGQDLRTLRLLERKERLKKLILRTGDPSLLYADHVDGYGIDFFRMVCEKNLEGIVGKHRASPYSSSAKWIKVKNPASTQSERRRELFEKSKGSNRVRREKVPDDLVATGNGRERSSQ